MAEERRQNELRRKLDKIHHSRQLYEALQSKNHELYMIKTNFYLKYFYLFLIDKWLMFKNVV
jgi:5-formaminoimidazole-4-carboxamide-1-beta-D-ribofuranosyl 5'-monophosphate synthetase